MLGRPIGFPGRHDRPGMGNFMLAWLYFVPALIWTDMLPVGTLGSMPMDALMAILLNFDDAGLYSASQVSRDFQRAAREISKLRYGICCNGELCRSLSAALFKFDALQAPIFGESPVGTWYRLLSSLGYGSIVAALEAEFGLCIYSGDGFRRFRPKLKLLEMLYDKRKNSALPYLLDQDPDDPQWIYCLQALAELGRFDLLGSLTFPKIEERHFCLILSIQLPTCIVMAAARSMQMHHPDLAISKLSILPSSRQMTGVCPEGQCPFLSCSTYISMGWRSRKTGCSRAGYQSNPFHSGCTCWEENIESFGSF